MSNTDGTRWRQRFENFERAFLLLQEVIEEKPLNEYSKLEQEGVIQRFEYTFELAWKTLKDRLFYEGYDEKTPRSVIRRAFAVELISEDDAEWWLDALEQRNLLAHTYNEATAKQALAFVSDHYYGIIERLHNSLKSESDRQ